MSCTLHTHTHVTSTTSLTVSDHHLYVLHSPHAHTRHIIHLRHNLSSSSLSPQLSTRTHTSHHPSPSHSLIIISISSTLHTHTHVTSSISLTVTISHHHLYLLNSPHAHTRHIIHTHVTSSPSQSPIVISISSTLQSTHTRHIIYLPHNLSSSSLSPDIEMMRDCQGDR